MIGNGAKSEHEGNSSFNSKNATGPAEAGIEVSGGRPANQDKLDANRIGEPQATLPGQHVPTDARLQGYFGSGLPTETARDRGSLSELASYTLSTIRNYLLRQAGKEEDIGKIGADGLQEAVTRADKACSQLLLNAVASMFPKSWTEEHRPKNDIDLVHAQPFVMVDPIDGTEEFKRELHGGYGNLFGFLESRDGRHVPVGGMVVTPRPDDRQFSYRLEDGTTKMLSGTELWRTAGPDGGIVYEVNGVATTPPAIRPLEAILESGQIRFHVRGVFAAKYNQEVAAGMHPGSRPMEPMEWAIAPEEKFQGLKNFDVRHYQEVVEYAHRLADSLGVKPVFVAAGGSGSGINELLAGRVDVLLTLAGDRAKEWDISPAEPLLEARARGALRGHLTQCNGQSFDARGFNTADPTLRDGYVASISVPKEVIFGASAGLEELNTKSKGGQVAQAATTEVAPTESVLKTILKAHGQEHLFDQLQSLPPGAKQGAFARELMDVAWNRLDPATLYRLPNFTSETSVRSGDVRTVEQCRATPGLVELGVSAYRNGEVGVLIVAGGSGTRLGASVPKGCVEAMALSKNSIYQHQCEKVRGLQERYGAKVPLYIMTSDATDTATRTFFKEHGNFGLDADQVVFFKQGVAPTVTKDGKVMLKDPASLLQNPDGHGGCYTALVKHGVLEHMRAHGVKYFMYGQIDNLLVPFDDPERVGLMVAENADVVIKTLSLRDPKEKQGRLVTVDGKTQVIEYIDVTEKMLQYRDADGFMSFGWGCPSIYCWSRQFFERLADTGKTLPLHPSTKSVKFYDPVTQEMVQGNGEKLESFIHDALIYGKVVGLRIENRDSEFAAVKQPQGADSIGDSIKLCSNEYRRWLEGVGVRVADNVTIEISPAIAANAGQFSEWLSRSPHALEILKRGVDSNLFISSPGSVTINAPQLLM